MYTIADFVLGYKDIRRIRIAANIHDVTLRKGVENFYTFADGSRISIIDDRAEKLEENNL